MAKKTAPAETVEETKEAEDFTSYASKPATPLQERFAEWVTDKTGYDPSSAKSKQAAFEEGIRLGVALRIPFQKSAENQAERAKRAAEPKPEKAAKAPKAAPVVEETEAPKAKGKKGKAVAAAEPAPATETAAAPAKPARGPRKTAATKVAPF